MWLDGLAAFEINPCGGTELAAFETNTYSHGRTALAAFQMITFPCGRMALVAF